MLNFIARTPVDGCLTQQAADIEKASGLCKQAVKLLCARKIDSLDKVIEFLHPAPDQFIDPMLLPDMELTAERIKAAVGDGEKIAIFCDYDADGITGGCALYLFLKRLGADVEITTPNRHKEGYGLNEPAVKDMAKAGVALIITVDCGITNLEEIELANKLGINVIVTDHHECPEKLPPTLYVVNPKRKDSLYPDSNLSGCGVVFKLIHAMSCLDEAMRYIDLIAIGTIADMVPLIGENRVIADLGIKKMRKNPWAGIAALAKQAKIDIGNITSFHAGFCLGPRINAAGRMDTAQLAIDLLKESKFSAAAAKKAAKLCELNERRKQEVETVLCEAEQIIDKFQYHSSPVIIVSSPNWNAGVLGIAAARLSKKYTRPCILLGGEPLLTGSARSIDGINIYDVLAQFSDRYQKFGGHEQAAGITIAADKLESLRYDICELVNNKYDESLFVRSSIFDLQLSIKDITKELVDDLRRLEPFGTGNEKPMIAVKAALLHKPRYIGKDDAPHLRFDIKQNGYMCDSIAFYYSDNHILIPERADFLCETGINDFTAKPQLIVREIGLRYSNSLADSFKQVYGKRLDDGFLKEAVNLAKKEMPKQQSLEEITSRIYNSINASRFGLCILVNSEPALNFLLSLPEVKTALIDGKLFLWDEKFFTQENCISCEKIPAHPRILRLGLFESALWCKQMKKEYKSHAKLYFAPREELLKIYSKLGIILKLKPVKMADAAKLLGISEKKAAFALRVFLELKLLIVDNDDKILALNKEGKRKELCNSSCYLGLKDLADG